PVSARLLSLSLIPCGLISSATAQTMSPNEWAERLNGPAGQAAIRVHARILDARDPLLSLWRSDTGYKPRTTISQLSIDVNGRPIVVPLSSFLDAYDPHAVRLSRAPLGFKLDITGGDGGDGYHLMIWFDSERVLRREVDAFGQAA